MIAITAEIAITVAKTKIVGITYSFIAPPKLWASSGLAVDLVCARLANQNFGNDIEICIGMLIDIPGLIFFII